MQKRASGGSRNSMNNNSSNNVPARGSLANPQTFGMLMWQSKLQDKLLLEQKDKRQKEVESQQRRVRTDQQHQHHQPSDESHASQHNRQTTPNLEIPQMIPGPAPYTITPPTPTVPVSPIVAATQQTETASNPTSVNGPTTATTTGVNQQPLFPNLSSRMRSSISCDNFGKLQPPPSILGNIISISQMGGSGSPRRSPSGKLLTVLRGDPEIRYHQKDTRGFDQTIRYLMDRDKVLEYKRDLDKQLEEKRKWRSRLGSGAIKEITRKGFIENGDNFDGSSKTHPWPASDSQYQNHHHHHYHHPFTYSGNSGSNNKNGTELAPLMRKFNSLPKLNGLSSTDVTRPYNHSPRNESFRPIQPDEVAESYSSQLKEKAWLSRKQQESERVATERHFQTWDSLWGRPGAGAPTIPLADRSLGHAVSFANLYGSSRSGGEVGGGLEQQHRYNKSSSNLGHNRVNLFKALHMTHQQQPGRPK